MTTEETDQPEDLKIHDLALEASEVRQHLAAVRQLLDDLEVARAAETARLLAVAERTAK
jgi:hypothetical protein